MTQESISNKLTELFELFKSGALSKEEYDQLKSQIINVGERHKVQEVVKNIQPEIVKEPVIESSPKEELLLESLPNNVNDSDNQASDKKSENIDLKIKPKKKIIKLDR